MIVPNTHVKLANNIRNVIKSAGGIIDDNVASYFSIAAMLNMWSKYKPVVALERLLDTDKRWKGQDGKCGLNIPVYNSPNAFRTAVKNEYVMWSYIPPVGGIQEPLRLGDFRGYCSDAYNPLGMVASNGILMDGKVTFEIDVAITDNSDTNLLLTDICVDGYNGTPLSEYYLGIYAWKNNDYSFRTSTEKIGTIKSLEIQVPINTVGEWQFIPFLSSNIQGDDETVGHFVSINKPVQTLNVISAGSLLKIDAFGAWDSSFKKVTEISAFITNATSSTIVFDGIKVELRRSINGQPESSELVSTVLYLDNVSVDSYSTYTIKIQDIIHTKDESYKYWLSAYSTQTTSVSYNEIEEMTPKDEQLLIYRV